MYVQMHIWMPQKLVERKPQIWKKARVIFLSKNKIKECHKILCMPYILTRAISFLAFCLYKALHLFFLWFSCDSPRAWPSDWCTVIRKVEIFSGETFLSTSFVSIAVLGERQWKGDKLQSFFWKMNLLIFDGVNSKSDLLLSLIRELVTGSGGHVPAGGVIQRSGWEELNDAPKGMKLLCSCPVHR